MVPIPAGAFLMGSPDLEPGRQDCEGPQHWVRLPPFSLAQTPITQAQWRQVAHWQPAAGDPPWERELNPDPSFFQRGRPEDDRRPADVQGALIPCPVKPSGNMPAERGQPRPMHLAPPSASARPMCLPQRQRKWACSPPTPGVCTTCTAMCGSGAPIICMKTMWGLRRMAAPGWIRMLMRVSQGCCAAALGAAFPRTAARPAAAGASRAAAATSGVSASVASPRACFFILKTYIPLHFAAGFRLMAFG
jgi:hypothetical protein